MLRFLPALIALLMVLTTSPAKATPSASEIAVARELFEQGKLLQDRGEWSRASAQYRKALEIKDTPGLRYRVGYCEEQLGHLVEAGVEYERARELLESGVHAGDVAELLPQTIASLRQRTPQLVLVLPNPPANVALRVEGASLAPAVIGRQIPLNPGRHSVVVSAPGFTSFTQTVELAEGERKRLRVLLAPAPAKDTSHDQGQTGTSDARATNTARTLVLIGEAALLAAGLGLGIIATMEKNQAEDDIQTLNRRISNTAGENEGTCAKPSPSIQGDCQNLATAVDEYALAEDLATVGFTVAGVGAAALVVTYLVWPGRNASVAAALLPDGGSLAISGSF
jgi:hypothetical protein